MESSDPCSQTHISSLVADFMSNRLKSHGYEWTAPIAKSASSIVTPTLSQALQDLSETFMTQFGHRIQAMTESIPSGGDVVDGTLDVSSSSSDDLIDYPVFKVVADELFSLGYEWSHILTLLVFASEIAYTRGVAKGHPEFVTCVHEYLVRYFTGSPSLRSWIQAQNGWNGFMDYALQQSNSNEGSNAAGSKHFSSLGSGLMVGLGTAFSFALASMTYAFVRS